MLQQEGETVPESPAPQQSSHRSPVNLSQSTENSLREEIRATQVAQSDIVKWKFIAIAAVGAFGLHVPLGDSVVGQIARNPWGHGLGVSLVGLIPLICLYTDLICLHYILRVITIGNFIKASYQEMRAKLPEQLLDYEGYVFAVRGRSAVKNPFGLEMAAVVGSSLLIDTILLLWAFYSMLSPSAADSLFQVCVSVALPSAGLLGTFFMFRSYLHRVETILKVPVNVTVRESAAES